MLRRGVGLQAVDRGDLLTPKEANTLGQDHPPIGRRREMIDDVAARQLVMLADAQHRVADQDVPPKNVKDPIPPRRREAGVTPVQRLAVALRERYLIERKPDGSLALLGRGGTATVFLAHDLRHDRPVALKVVHPELAAPPGARKLPSIVSPPRT